MDNSLEIKKEFFTPDVESFIRSMIKEYHLRREDLLLAIQQFGFIKSRIRNYCRIAADIKEKK